LQEGYRTGIDALGHAHPQCLGHAKHLSRLREPIIMLTTRYDIYLQ
jgi:hypothetical protein